MKETMEDTKKDIPKKKRRSWNSWSSWNSRQVIALAGVILLVLLYVITLIAAIVDSSQSAQWFRICLFATLALPLILWIYSWMYGRLTGKSAIGDPDGAANPQFPSKGNDGSADQESVSKGDH